MQRRSYPLSILVPYKGGHNTIISARFHAIKRGVGGIEVDEIFLSIGAARIYDGPVIA
jgi:hypothetical protein